LTEGQLEISHDGNSWVNDLFKFLDKFLKSTRKVFYRNGISGIKNWNIEFSMTLNLFRAISSSAC